MGINDNTLNKQQTQKRILTATVLAFIFFLAYDFLYLQPKQAAVNAANEQNKQVAQKQTNEANSAPTTMTQDAPIAQQTTNQAPVTNTTSKSGIVSTITTKHNIFEIDNLGRISQVTLKDTQYVDENNEQLHLFANNQLRPLEVRFTDGQTNSQAFETNVTASAKTLDATSKVQTLTLTQELSKTTLTKIITFHPDGHYSLKVSTTNKQPFFITPGFRPHLSVDMYADHGALMLLNDGTLNIIEDEDMDNNAEIVGVQIASAFSKYYATVLYNFDKSMAVSVMKDQNDSPNMFIHASDNIELNGYIGPKEYKTLEALHPKMTNVIEYGWFTFIAKPMFAMLMWVQSYVGNWGWTIVLTTILIKLVLFPLSHKGMVSMNRLKELAPKMKAIQEKYGDDKQKASMHLMELYKKEGANPMGGCLPLLLQIPVFFAIYRVLINAIELKGAEWILFFNDLTHTISFPNLLDPYIILPLLMGFTMWLQQKITPNTMQDEMQRKIFQLLPVMFTIFFIFFPAGLVLYWTINNIFTITHQYYINRAFEQAKEQRHEKHLEEKKSHKKK